VWFRVSRYFTQLPEETARLPLICPKRQVTYLLFEFIILIVETVLFTLLLKQHSKLRRALFAATTNIVSFVAGFMLMPLITVL